MTLGCQRSKLRDKGAPSPQGTVDTMAWITKKTTSKGETRYLVGWREPDGTRKHESRRTKAEADRLKRQVEDQLDRNEYTSSGVVRGGSTTASGAAAREPNTASGRWARPV